MASGTSRQLAVSMTPPMLRTTTTFFPAAWKAAATSRRSDRSAADNSKSFSRVRSTNSPDRRPIVTRAAPASFASRAISSAGTAISGTGGLGMNGRAEASARFSCSATYAA